MNAVRTSPLFAPTTRNLLLYGGYVVLSCLASLTITSVHLTHYFVGSFLLALVLIGPVAYLLFCSHSIPIRSLALSRAWWVSAVMVFAILDVVRYPVEMRKPIPNCASAALIQPAKALAHGTDPYLAPLPGDVPISPGPGWILLLSPLTLSGAVMLITPLCVALCAYLIEMRYPIGAAVFVTLVVMEPDLLAQTFVGHDLFAIPIFFAILCLLADCWSGSRGKIAALAVVAAVFATSRLPMIGLLVVLGIGLLRRDARTGRLFLSISVVLSLLIQGVFFLWARHDHVVYQPMHLFTRTARADSRFSLLAVAILCAAAAWILLKMKADVADWILGGGLFLTAFIAVGFGELVLWNYRFPRWEGSNYVSFGSPLLIAALALSRATASVRDDIQPAGYTSTAT